MEAGEEGYGVGGKEERDGAGTGAEGAVKPGAGAGADTGNGPGDPGLVGTAAVSPGGVESTCPGLEETGAVERDEGAGVMGMDPWPVGAGLVEPALGAGVGPEPVPPGVTTPGVGVADTGPLAADAMDPGPLSPRLGLLSAPVASAGGPGPTVGVPSAPEPLDCGSTRRGDGGRGDTLPRKPPFSPAGAGFSVPSPRLVFPPGSSVVPVLSKRLAFPGSSVEEDTFPLLEGTGPGSPLGSALASALVDSPLAEPCVADPSPDLSGAAAVTDPCLDADLGLDLACSDPDLLLTDAADFPGLSVADPCLDPDLGLA